MAKYVRDLEQPVHTHPEFQAASTLQPFEVSCFNRHVTLVESVDDLEYWKHVNYGGDDNRYLGVACAHPECGRYAVAESYGEDDRNPKFFSWNAENKSGQEVVHSLPRSSTNLRPEIPHAARDAAYRQFTGTSETAACSC